MSLEAAITAHTQLSPAEAPIAACLWRARRWVSTAAINEATRLHRPHADALRQGAAVRVHIHNIRWKLGRNSVLSMEGRGYTLGADGVLAIKSALLKAQSDLTSALEAAE